MTQNVVESRLTSTSRKEKADEQMLCWIWRFKYVFHILQEPWKEFKRWKHPKFVFVFVTKEMFDFNV